MIYFTTFIFTLLLAHIARAMPACGDVASFEDMHDPMYDDKQLILYPPIATWHDLYDNSSGHTIDLMCSNLAIPFPLYCNFPTFPYIGGAFDIQEHNSPNCGKCWNLTNTETDKFIYFTAINTSKRGFSFVLSRQALMALSGGLAPLVVSADLVPAHFCGF